MDEGRLAEARNAEEEGAGGTIRGRLASCPGIMFTAPDTTGGPFRAGDAIRLTDTERNDRPAGEIRRTKGEWRGVIPGHGRPNDVVTWRGASPTGALDGLVERMVRAYHKAVEHDEAEAREAATNEAAAGEEFADWANGQTPAEGVDEKA